MKGVVVYYSRWGNCKQVAESVAKGLEETGHEVSLVDAGSQKALEVEPDFLLVGSPTRIGKMAGPVKKFIKKAVPDAWEGKPFAAFGTGLQSALEKSEPNAADGIHLALEAMGLKPIAPAFKAGVVEMKGPLVEGDRERALEFGKEVGAALGG
ncbi:MAG: flavodoxin domain-containing protein [Actinobacteria bacterium]|nr:flavodoxin domain-containing protein [Actinomycetota bacterium]